MTVKTLLRLIIYIVLLSFHKVSLAQIKLFNRAELATINKAVYTAVSQKALQGKVLAFEFNKSIKDVPSIIVEIEAQEIEFFMDETDNRQDYDYSWYGRSKDRLSSIALTYLDGYLAGNIFINTRNFIISPNGNGKIFLYEKSLDNIIPDHAESSKTPEEIIVPRTERLDAENLRTNITDGVRKIRVLLAYTDAAETGILGAGFTIPLFLQNAITLTNQTFVNSNVAHRVRLACGVRTFYNPSAEAQGHDNAANRLKILNDGYMDEIITHRDNYSADVCVVIINNASICGSSAQIGSNSANAYASVHWGCVTDNNTLGHEIGHLHGCRHNPEEDPANSPAAYGHGLRNDANSWRTVMSYNCSPTCPRLPFWSNPDILFGGVPMGTTSTHDNARLLDETSAAIAAYRTAPATRTLTGTSNLVYKGYGEAIATSEIILSDNLEVALGCELNVFVDPLAGNNDYFPFRIGADETVSVERELPEGPEFSIFPNPSSGLITVKATNGKKFDVTITDSSGQHVSDSNSGQESELKMKLKDHKPGLYIIQIKSEDKTYSRKIIIN
ncbi:T9SS type A sorting domain-containing protein [Dyadobacter sp. LJ53]|uniref:zinc-dependent metalloprotease n=1 Tax=Dyadobacter chenwenxiniae TaxID=2906456 RepID=UPI001F179254|nr:zinc-dependent metalloprotease [Dyadobacter chenwenxiniae]MCF0049551.1 T9SS type A sorting domain-containing protein [Dyadobacter chenwenxiniae]